MAIVSNLDLIRRVSLFSDLTPIQSSILANAVDKKRFKRNENIVEQGTVSPCLYMILSGKARVSSVNDKGREVIIASLGVGDCIGEMSLIDGLPHSATVRCELVTDVLTLQRDAFLSCLHTNATMSEAIMRSLVRRLRNADKQIQALALMDVYGRVQETLTEFAQHQPDGRMLLLQRVSRQDVAKMVGASREMVSRVMRHFENDGVLVPLEGGGFELKPRMQSVE